MREQADRRRSPRISCDLSLEYAVPGARTQEGRIANIGLLGMLLLTQQDHLPVGTDLLLRFHLPLSHRPVQTRGTVRWAIPGKTGVEFVHQDELWRYDAKKLAEQRELETRRRLTRE